MTNNLTTLKTFVAKHERIFLPAALLFGFLFDALTLRKVDLLPETIVVYVYLTVSAVMIWALHLEEAGRLRGRFIERVRPFIPLALTYAFGGLFSAFVVFYTKSALISDSWPFILALVSVVVALEFLREYRSKLIFNVTLYYLALFSFSIYSVPLWLGRMGTDIFFLSTLVALGLFSVFCVLLFLASKTQLIRQAKKISGAVGAVTIALVFFYSANILPPLPLVLKDIGVYHNIVRDERGYALQGEHSTFFDALFGQNMHVVPNSPLFVFSSVYTPVRLDADIVHRWEFFDPAERKWGVSTVVSYPAEGGREEGYRGYSLKQSLLPGRWRVTVETPDGLKIGRTEFTVVSAQEPPELVTEFR